MVELKDRVFILQLVVQFEGLKRYSCTMCTHCFFPANFPSLCYTYIHDVVSPDVFFFIVYNGQLVSCWDLGKLFCWQFNAKNKTKCVWSWNVHLMSRPRINKSGDCKKTLGKQGVKETDRETDSIYPPPPLSFLTQPKPLPSAPAPLFSKIKVYWACIKYMPKLKPVSFSAGVF